LYITERQSAEGRFFHRRCFACFICRQPLNRNDYCFQASSGRFFCRLHAPNDEDQEKEEKEDDEEEEEDEEKIEIKDEGDILSFFDFGISQFCLHLIDWLEVKLEPVTRWRYQFQSFNIREFLLDWILLIFVGTLLILAHHYIFISIYSMP